MQRFLRKPDAAVARQLADLRPTSVVLLQRAARDTLTADPHHPDLATPYLERARRITPVNREMAFASGWVRLYEADQPWRRNNPREALRLVDRLATEATTLPLEVADAFNFQLVYLYVALGRLERARQLAEASAPAARKQAVLWAVAAREDTAALRAVLRREFPNPADAADSTTFLIEAGLLDAARQAIAALQRRAQPAPPGLLLLFKGELALAEGRIKEGIALLERSQVGSPPIQGTRAALKLADAWSAKGDPGRAIAVLEDIRARSALDPQLFALAVRVTIPERLARLYRKTGRIADAQAIEDELRELLAVADDDHPIKRRLAAQRSGAQPR